MRDVVLDVESTTLISGATEEVGAAIARRFAAGGAKIALNDAASSPMLDDLAQELGGVAAPGGHTNHDHVTSMIEKLIETSGPIGTLVCNIEHLSMSPFLEHSPDDWWAVVDANLTGVFYLIQAVLPSMRSLSAGRIVIVLSNSGVSGWANATAYAASHAGIIALIKSCGRELAPEGIIVNGIALGVEANERSMATSGGDFDAQLIPAGRLARPEEIASSVAFLADRRMLTMVGTILQVNGGEARGRV
jgi:NAD(P)-dependent dehydrogenase (short-subunit alcohol dehydrogenase family)